MSEKTINSTLVQESSSRGEIRNFEIYNNKFMKIQTHDLFGDKSYHINLSILEPWPVHHRYIAWRWVLACLYFGFSTLVFSYYVYSNPNSNNPVSVFLIALFLLTLVSLLFAVYRSPNVTEFRSRYGNCPLISLRQNKPDAKTFGQFVAETRMRILAASQHVNFDKKQMLSFELDEIQRLKEEGTLSKELYQRARERVLKMKI